MRLLSIAGGLTLIVPGTVTDIVGIVLVGGVFVAQKLPDWRKQNA
jgi:UPF0716 family protein affecting phage T7 exclusion